MKCPEQASKKQKWIAGGGVWMRGVGALTDEGREGCGVSFLGDENILDPDGDDGCETGRVQMHELHTSKC